MGGQVECFPAVVFKDQQVDAQMNDQEADQEQSCQRHYDLFGDG
jgi:hypothetical protein